MTATSSFTLATKAVAVGLFSLLAAHSWAAKPQHPWAAMAQADADFITDRIMQESISAIYPSKDAFAAQLAAARRVFDAESAQVSNYTGYREALGHFVGAMQDQHLVLYFSLTPTTYQWPGFMTVYRGGRYLALASRPGDAPEQDITQCDGKPMAQWIRQVAAYQQLPPAGLEATRVRATPIVFRDSGSPFVARPRVCTIGGRDVTLEWQSVAAGKWAADVSAATIFRDRVTAVAPFGDHGAWVRMGIFQPQTPVEGKAFKQLIAAAPTLRDKSVIVLDVRGNGGGPYEWFMGFLRALYGTEYADYHARARLQIANVFRVTPTVLKEFDSDDGAEVGDLAPPADGTPFDPDNARLRSALAAGKTLLFTPANARAIPKPKRLPANPVTARVLVLTDYNCGSACISFVDEMKRFPGVVHIGVETHVDSRTGTALNTPLPSGNGVISVPAMTRDGRERGDNIAHRPDHIYTGNILDTEAVKAWVRDEVVANGDGR